MYAREQAVKEHKLLKKVIEYSFIVFCIYYRIRCICYSFCTYMCVYNKAMKVNLHIRTPSDDILHHILHPFVAAYGREVIYPLWKRPYGQTHTLF